MIFGNSLVGVYPIQELLERQGRGARLLAMHFSEDLRNQFGLLMEEGNSAMAAGRMLLISRGTASRWGRMDRNRSWPDHRAAGRVRANWNRSCFSPMGLLRGIRRRHITLKEMQGTLFQAHVVRVHHSSMDVALRRHVYTSKWSSLLGNATGKGCQGLTPRLAALANAVRAESAATLDVH